MTEFITGFGAGAAFKWMAEYVVKHHDTKVANRRKMLIGDIDELSRRIDPLAKSAMSYYSKPAADGQDLARQIRVDFKSFSARWTSLCTALPVVGRAPLPNKPLIGFRQALTLNLDDMARAKALALDSQIIENILSAMDEVHCILSDAKFNLN